MGTARGRRALATALLITLTTAGCATSTPGAAPTTSATPPTPGPTATSTPEPTPADPLASVDSVVVSGTGLALVRGDDVLETLPFVGGDLDEVRALLDRVFADDAVAAGSVSEHPCVADQTRWSWGDALYLASPSLTTDDGSLHLVLRGSTLPGGQGDVALETSEGVAVGDEVAPLVDLVSGLDPSRVEQDDPSVGGRTRVLYDLVRDDSDELGPYHYGALAEAEGGAVTVVDTPRYLQDRC